MMNASVSYGPYRVRPDKRAGRLTSRWVVDIPLRIAGKRRREFFENREEAIKFAKLMCEPKVLPVQPSELACRDYFFSSVVEEWLSHQSSRVQTGKKRQSSLDKDKAVLVSIKRFLGFLTLQQITEEKICEYQAFRKQKGRKPETINSDTSVLMKILRWALRKGMLQKLPQTETIPEPMRRIEEVPTPEEMARLIAMLPDRLKTFVRFLAETGCRTSEVRYLLWENVDLMNRTVRIRAHENFTPKTQHSNRELCLGEGLAGELALLPRKSEYVFPSQRNHKKPLGHFRRAFRSAVIKADIRRNERSLKITPKTLRKAYMTWAAMEPGLNLAHVQYLVGHAPGSKATAKHYVKTPEAIRRKGVLELSLPVDAGSNLAASGSRSENSGPMQSDQTSLQRRISAVSRASGQLPMLLSSF